MNVIADGEVCVDLHTERGHYDPLRELAAENQISDVGLVEACRTASIPIPPRAHWNRGNAGKPT